MKQPSGKKRPKNSEAPVEGESSRRFSIAFSQVILEKIEKGMKAKGFNNNISGYLADCVRRQEERDVEFEALRRVAGGSATADQVVLLAAKNIVKRAAKGKDPEAKSNLEILADHDSTPMGEIIGFRAGVEHVKTV